MVSPEPGVADIVTLPGPQFDAPVPIGVVGSGLIIARTAVREEDEHPLYAST